MNDDEAAAYYADPANRRIDPTVPPVRHVGHKLQELVRELSEAEFEFVPAPPDRLHRAIVALCDHVGVPNRWDQEGP